MPKRPLAGIRDSLRDEEPPITRPMEMPDVPLPASSSTTHESNVPEIGAEHLVDEPKARTDRPESAQDTDRTVEAVPESQEPVTLLDQTLEPSLSPAESSALAPAVPVPAMTFQEYLRTPGWSFEEAAVLFGLVDMELVDEDSPADETRPADDNNANDEEDENDAANDDASENDEAGENEEDAGEADLFPPTNDAAEEESKEEEEELSEANVAEEVKSSAEAEPFPPTNAAAADNNTNDTVEVAPLPLPTAEDAHATVEASSFADLARESSFTFSMPTSQFAQDAGLTVEAIPTRLAIARDEDNAVEATPPLVPLPMLIAQLARQTAFPFGATAPTAAEDAGRVAEAPFFAEDADRTAEASQVAEDAMDPVQAAPMYQEPTAGEAGLADADEPITLDNLHPEELDLVGYEFQMPTYSAQAEGNATENPNQAYDSLEPAAAQPIDFENVDFSLPAGNAAGTEMDLSGPETSGAEVPSLSEFASEMDMIVNDAPQLGQLSEGFYSSATAFEQQMAQFANELDYAAAQAQPDAQGPNSTSAALPGPEPEAPAPEPVQAQEDWAPAQAATEAQVQAQAQEAQEAQIQAPVQQANDEMNWLAESEANAPRPFQFTGSSERNSETPSQAQPIEEFRPVLPRLAQSINTEVSMEDAPSGVSQPATPAGLFVGTPMEVSTPVTPSPRRLLTPVRPSHATPLANTNNRQAQLAAPVPATAAAPEPSTPQVRTPAPVLDSGTLRTPTSADRPAFDIIPAKWILESKPKSTYTIPLAGTRGESKLKGRPVPTSKGGRQRQTDEMIAKEKQRLAWEEASWNDYHKPLHNPVVDGELDEQKLLAVMARLDQLDAEYRASMASLNEEVTARRTAETRRYFDEKLRRDAERFQARQKQRPAANPFLAKKPAKKQPPPAKK